MKTSIQITRQMNFLFAKNNEVPFISQGIRKNLSVMFVLFLAISGLRVNAAIHEIFPAGSLILNLYSSTCPGNPDSLYEVLGLESTISTMLSSSDLLVVEEGHHLQQLAFDLQPTLFIRNGNLSNPGRKTPKCIDSDASSVMKLYESNPQYKQVEFLTIRIEKASDMATVVNLPSLDDFTNLKYIYYICSFKICSSPGCEKTLISQMVQGSRNPRILILYKISIAN